MRKYLAIATSLLLCSCAQDNHYTISGKHFNSIEGDTVKMVVFGTRDSVINSAVLDVMGNYSFSGEVNEPVRVTLHMGEHNNTIGQLYLEPGEIVGETVENQERFSGTPLNDINCAIYAKITAIEEEYTKISESGAENIAEMHAKLMDDYMEIIEFAVKDNLDNILGVNEFEYSYVSSLSAQEALDMISKFSPEMQETELLINAKKRAETMLKTEVGEQYIPITLPNTKGEKVAVESLIGDGKYVLIDFWATWCRPCMGEIPHLKEAYAEYHAKGFEIYGVSLDRNQAAWTKFADTLPWTNVLCAEKDYSVTDDYAIRSIPTNLLIGPDGVILAKNLRGDEVANKLAELLK